MAFMTWAFVSEADTTASTSVMKKKNERIALNADDTRFYDAVQQVTQTGLSASGLCVLVLTVHVLIGLVLTYAGTRSARWD